MEKVFFKNIRKEILTLLSEAEDSVYVAMAWFTNKQLLEALISCQKRGVTVEIIILDDGINRNDAFGLDFSSLISEGASLYLFNPQEKLMHNKFCIIDAKKVITGSYNWTNYAEHRNLENIIITDNEIAINSYVQAFHEIKEIQNKTISYTRVPNDLITRENYSGNYHDYELEYKYFKEKPAHHIDSEPKAVEVHNRQNPKAACNIGFHAYINGNDNGLRVLIDKGQELPIAITKDSWLNRDDIDKISCEIYFGDINDSIIGNKKLVSLDLDIPKKKKNELHFKTKITMDTNGYLHTEFLCSETGKSKEFTTCKSELVDYK